MDKKQIHGRGYRWVLAALLIAALSGCHDDEIKSAGNTPLSGGIAPPPSTPAPTPAPEPVPQVRAATLEWTAPTTKTNGSALTDLAGYRIHYGKNVRSLDSVIEIRNPGISSYMIENLPPGTYYFAVTAFDARNHESERSNAGRKEII